MSMIVSLVGGIVNGISARFIGLILKHLEAQTTKLCVALMEPEVQNLDLSVCARCSYRIDVIVQPQH